MELSPNKFLKLSLLCFFDKVTELVLACFKLFTKPLIFAHFSDTQLFVTDFSIILTKKTLMSIALLYMLKC